MSETCEVPGCTKEADNHGLCGMHANRLKRNGHFDLTRRPNGTGNINQGGYVDIRWNGRRTYGHIKVAEVALGKPLPLGAVVHHVDTNRANNAPTNLVICPNEAYHRLLHRRMAAMDACGNPNFRKCPLCGVWDNPARLSNRNLHRECAARDRRERYEMEKANAIPA